MPLALASPSSFSKTAPKSSPRRGPSAIRSSPLSTGSSQAALAVMPAFVELSKAAGLDVSSDADDS